MAAPNIHDFAKTNLPTGYDFVKKEDGIAVPVFNFKTPDGNIQVPVNKYLVHSNETFKNATVVLQKLLKMKSKPIPWLYRVLCMLDIISRTVDGLNIEFIVKYNSNDKIDYNKKYALHKKKLGTPAAPAAPAKTAEKKAPPVEKAKPTSKPVEKKSETSVVPKKKAESDSESVKKVKPTSKPTTKPSAKPAEKKTETKVKPVEKPNGKKDFADPKPTKLKVRTAEDDQSSTSESDSENIVRPNSLQCNFPNTFDPVQKFLYLDDENALAEDESVLDEALKTSSMKEHIFNIRDPSKIQAGGEGDVFMDKCVFYIDKSEKTSDIVQFRKLWNTRITKGPLVEWALLLDWNYRCFVNAGQETTAKPNHMEVSVVFIRTEYYEPYTPVIMIRELDSIQRSELKEIPKKVYFFRTFYSIGAFLNSLILPEAKKREQPIRANTGVKALTSVIGGNHLSDVVKWPEDITAQEMRTKYGVELEKVHPQTPTPAQEPIDSMDVVTENGTKEQQRHIESLNKELMTLKKTLATVENERTVLQKKLKTQEDDSEKIRKAISDLSSLVGDIEKTYPETFKSNYAQRGTISDKLSVVLGLIDKLKEDLGQARQLARQRETVIKQMNEENSSGSANNKRQLDQLQRENLTLVAEMKKQKQDIDTSNQETFRLNDQLTRASQNYNKVTDAILRLRENMHEKMSEGIKNFVVKQMEMDYSEMYKTFQELARLGMIGADPVDRLKKIEERTSNMFSAVNSQ